MKSVIIIGAGVVGCAIAYELSSHYNVTVIEKHEDLLGDNQSNRNSGVIHAGIYYPKTIMPHKARLCAEGNSLTYEFCKKHHVAHKQCGKIVIAATEEEKEYLRFVEEIAKENNISYEFFSREELLKNYPDVNGLCGLYFPTSGIINPKEYLHALYQLSVQNNASFVFGEEVKEVVFGEKITVITTSKTVQSDYIINAAGLSADKVAKLINTKNTYCLYPIKGEIAKVERKKYPLSSNIYSVPHGYTKEEGILSLPLDEFKKKLYDKEIGMTVGVHLSPTIDEKGNLGEYVTAGPLYNTKNNSEESLLNSFEDKIKKILPGIKKKDIELHYTGFNAKGYSDFVIEKDQDYKQCIHLIGIDSPGLTSSPAIALYVKEMLLK